MFDLRRYMASGRFFLRWTWADGFVEKDEVTLWGVRVWQAAIINTTNQVLQVPSSVLLEEHQSTVACFHLLAQMYKGLLHLHCIRFLVCPVFLSAYFWSCSLFPSSFLGRGSEHLECLKTWDIFWGLPPRQRLPGSSVLCYYCRGATASWLFIWWLEGPWIKAFGHQFRHEKLAKDEDSDDDNNDQDDNA